jgi:hypothetical protein
MRSASRHGPGQRQWDTTWCRLGSDRRLLCRESYCDAVHGSSTIVWCPEREDLFAYYAGQDEGQRLFRFAHNRLELLSTRELL